MNAQRHPSPRPSSLEYVLAPSNTGALTMNRRHHLLWGNSAARRLLDLDDPVPQDVPLAALEYLWTLLPAAVRAPGSPGEVSHWTGETRRRGRDGLERTLDIEAAVVRDEHGVPAEATILLRDVSAMSRLHAELLYQASHDALTGLPNRARLRRVSAEAVERLRAGGGTLALLFVDLDHVKEVNDVAGHDVGDQVIVYAGQRLAASIRPRDVVARLGGDEFVVVCEDVTDSHAALEVAERIRRAVSEQVEVLGHTISVAASIGVAVLSGDAARHDDRSPHDVADTLLHQADSAMYRAKQRGRGRSELFDDELGRQIARRRALGVELERALQTGGLSCIWLPVVDLVRDSVTGWYAQLSWRPGDDAELGHEEIMALATSTGAELGVGRWLLEQADGAPTVVPRHRVMLPLSAAQIADPRAVDVARAMVHRLNDVATALTIMVDESVLGSTDHDVDRALRSLPRFGIGLGVTGVGATGTPLRALREHAVERLVLHPSLIADLGVSPTAEALTRSMVYLGHSLDATVGADLGPGDPASLARRTERLRALGCDEIIGRPVASPRHQELTAT